MNKIYAERKPAEQQLVDKGGKFKNSVCLYTISELKDLNLDPGRKGSIGSLENAECEQWKIAVASIMTKSMLQVGHKRAMSVPICMQVAGF